MTVMPLLCQRRRDDGCAMRRCPVQLLLLLRYYAR